MTARPPAMEHLLVLPNASAHAEPPDAAPAAPAHQTRLLDLPGIDSPWRYAWARARAAWSGLLAPHGLRRGSIPSYSATVQISLRLAHRWRAVFDVPSRAAGSVPLLSHESVGALLQARLLADLGFQRRRVTHQRHRTILHAGVQALAASRQQRLSCHLHRMLRLSEDRLLVDLRTVVHDDQGQLLCEIDDGFLVDRLPPEQLAGLPSDRALLRELLGVRCRLPRLSTVVGAARLSEMPVPDSMGRRYGRIAGRFNPLHCCRLGAWLMGAPRPALQTQALRNLVVRHLAELRVAMNWLSLTFVAPAWLGQTLMLVVDGAEVEVHDAKGHLVAFGTVDG